MREFKVIGHRGACAHEPENTLGSVRRAIADRADMIEVDVRLAAGEIVVIHDASVDRTTDASGSVYDKSVAELRSLGIPTLSEVLAETRGIVPLNIEMKDLGVCAPACDLLADDRAEVLLSSFHPEAMFEARARLPAVAIGILGENHPEADQAMFSLARKLGAVSVHPHVETVSAQLVATAHRGGLQVLPYTARTPAQLQALLDYGVDGCFADDPQWARQFAAKCLRPSSFPGGSSRVE